MLVMTIINVILLFNTHFIHFNWANYSMKLLRYWKCLLAKGIDTWLGFPVHACQAPFEPWSTEWDLFPLGPSTWYLYTSRSSSPISISLIEVFGVSMSVWCVGPLNCFYHLPGLKLCCTQKTILGLKLAASLFSQMFQTWSIEKSHIHKNMVKVACPVSVKITISYRNFVL